MWLQRTFVSLAYVLLGLTCVAGLSGCGGAEEDAASGPEEVSLPPEDREVSSLETPHVDDGTGAMTGSPVEVAPFLPLPETTPPPLPETTPPPLAADLAPPKPVELAPAVPRMSIRPREMETAAPVPQPRMMAPMSMAPSTRDMTAAREAEAGLDEGTFRMMAPATDSPSPRMVEMSREPAARETPPDTMAMEMAPPEAAEEVRSSVRQPVAEDRGDYEAVTVFYGTDRTSNATSGQPAQPHRLWLYAAGVCLSLFGLFAIMAKWSSRKKTFAGLAVLCFSAGGVLALLGGIAWTQRGGAVAGPKLEYGNGRGTFVMGTCEVSIPKDHQAAELEAPSVFKLDFVEDPTRHVVLLDIEEKNSEDFFSQLRDRVAYSDSKDAFVFVHGFNVTFEDAARRTAQLAYDLKFQGAPIFYSWPSQGGLFQYAVDETNVVWTVPHLQQFLKDIAKQSGARSVHLIAHSMGNRALTTALREISMEMRGTPPLFHEVVLTAPDIDAEIFRRDIAPAIVSTAKRVTLYASSNDEALVLSKQVHGYPRAGDSGAGLVVIPGIETIDVSAVDTSLLGHNYYGDNATVISDMIDLVRNSKSASERSWLETARLDDLLYWVFRLDRAAVGTAPRPGPTRY